MANIEQIIYADGKVEIVDDFKNLVKNLDESGLIEKEKTREQALFEPIQYIRKKHNHSNRMDGKPVEAKATA